MYVAGMCQGQAVPQRGFNTKDTKRTAEIFGKRKSVRIVSFVFKLTRMEFEYLPV